MCGYVALVDWRYVFWGLIVCAGLFCLGFNCFEFCCLFLVVISDVGLFIVVSLLILFEFCCFGVCLMYCWLVCYNSCVYIRLVLLGWLFDNGVVYFYFNFYCLYLFLFVCFGGSDTMGFWYIECLFWVGVLCDELVLLICWWVCGLMY